MERQRGSTHQDRNHIGLPNSSMSNFTPPPPPQINQLESPVKLPLAPIISTAPDRRGISHAAMPASTRRGGAIFSPAVQTLDHNNIPPPPQLSPPPPPKDPTPDPDPAAPSNNSTKTPPPPPPPASTVRYRECLKNHVASMGGNVVDGCGEFMPGGEEGSPEYLRCAACDCHRNFHRKEVEGEPHASSHNNNNNNSTHRSTPQFHGHHQKHSSHHPHGFSGPPTIVNFGGAGAAAESSSEDLNMFRSEGYGPGGGSSSRKRFRTKFSQDQKDKMQEFAAKIGWRIQKQEEQEVQRFCSEVGVKRQVFKVWMHNNKQAIKKRSQTSSE